MEKENIKTVTIEDFKNSQHILDYIDDDFAIVNSLEGTPYSNDTIKLNCFLIAVCIEGCIQLDVNYRTATMKFGSTSSGYFFKLLLIKSTAHFHWAFSA